jgi:biopolymer transport protein ExbD
MKLNLESTEPDVRIEIVPLIDVIFCILTFFILAAVTLTRQAAINVDLPRATSSTSQMRQILIVSVDPIGQTYVEKLPVTKAQLQQAILNFRQQNPQGMMVLYASRSASYNDVVQVLDLLRATGGDRVALATLPGEAGGDASPFPEIPSTGSPNGSLVPSPSTPNSLNPAAPSDPFNLRTPTDSSPSSNPGSNLLPSPGKAGSVDRSLLEQPTVPNQSKTPISPED